MITAGIVGATGYTGVELMRLISMHPHAKLQIVTSRSEAGRSVTELFPSLRGMLDLRFSQPDDEALSECDVIFFATPNGTAMEHVPFLLKNGQKIIDLSADFRLKDIIEWEKWYGQKHSCPELVSEAVYGLPEVNREKIALARLVANPGCYPTAIQLGFLPLIENNLVETDTLIADAKSGVSGGGKKLTSSLLFSESSDSFSAYAASGHRHLPEIKQGLQSMSKENIDMIFVPHLVPMIRGIHATLYARLKNTELDLYKIYHDRYKDEPFVDVMEPGSHPNTNTVRGTNTCRLSCHRPQNGNTAVILAVEDNLVKGAAGQAIQNMNIMFNLEETSGLLHPACFP
ncbi:MAG: N-acetyl-gamma-glutamyl-phosphate reductase [Gammaproteobacteria bacterium]|jgi:N-acetyl-gamma-glutamyl-phosphate reductase